MRELVRRNRVRDGLLYLQVTRGAVRRDHPHSARCAAPDADHDGAARSTGRFRAQRREDGIAVITRPDIAGPAATSRRRSFCANLLAKTAARRAGAYEAWLVDARRSS